MHPKLAGACRPEWQFFLLDVNNQPVRRLRNVAGGRLEIVAQSRLGVSGEIVFTGAPGIDWLSQRLRIVYYRGWLVLSRGRWRLCFLLRRVKR